MGLLCSQTVSSVRRATWVAWVWCMRHTRRRRFSLDRTDLGYQFRPRVHRRLRGSRARLRRRSVMCGGEERRKKYCVATPQLFQNFFCDDYGFYSKSTNPSPCRRGGGVAKPLGLFNQLLNILYVNCFCV